MHDPLQAKEKHNSECVSTPSRRLGLYIHIPFCATTCDFCAFYQEKPSKEKFLRFREGIRWEYKHVRDASLFDTVYWGGGTPGLLPVDELYSLGTLIQPFLREGAEWTVELAPALVNPTKLRTLRELGVNRISMGVQSMDPVTLQRLGRDHSPEQIVRAVEMIREAGFGSLNLDLMFALPGQEPCDWLYDLDRAIAMEPEHISTYCLTFEEDTALWVQLQNGQHQRDAVKEAAFYRQTWHHLEAAGYAQYEISNFTQPGHACQHNLDTWRMQEWIGIGPSAASQYSGFRTQNHASIEQWHKDLGAGKLATSLQTPLSEEERAQDALLFGLRMNEGVNIELWETQHQYSLSRGALGKRLQQLRDHELLDHNDRDTLRLTEEGRLFADRIAIELMEAWETALT